MLNQFVYTKPKLSRLCGCLNKLTQENSRLSKLSSFMVVCLCFVSTNSFKRSLEIN